MFDTIKLAAIITVVAAASSSYWYVSNLQTNLELSETNNSLLLSMVNTQKETLAQMDIDILEIKELNTSLRGLSTVLGNELKDLNERFEIRANGTSRDFGAITRSKPNLILKIVNKATKNVNRCAELATGAKLEKGETNNECKHLIETLSI